MLGVYEGKQVDLTHDVFLFYGFIKSST